MVQVIENRAELEGDLVSIADDASRPGHKRVTVAVTSVSPIEPYPNLLGDTVGRTIDLTIPVNEMVTLTPGRRVRCRARRTGPSAVFAESCTALGP